MKFTWKIAIALAVVLCLAATLISCIGDDDKDFVYVTNEAGEFVTDEAGELVTEKVSETTTDSSESDNGVKLENIDTDKNWSELHTPTKPN